MSCMLDIAGSTETVMLHKRSYCDIRAHLKLSAQSIALANDIIQPLLVRKAALRSSLSRLPNYGSKVLLFS
jgi:hypothetical protein